LIQDAGGLQAYMIGSSAYSRTFFSTTSLLHGAGITGLRRNILSKLIPYTLYAWGLALLPAIIYWGMRFLHHWQAWLKNRKVWFVILSIAPALAFYAFIHMGQQGLVFVFMPVLFVLSAEALRRLLPNSAHLKLATAGIALIGAAIFVLAPVYPLGINGPKLLAYSTIREHDQQLADQISAVRSQFAPEDTVIFSAGWRFMDYYLPEYALASAEIGSQGEANAGALTKVDFDRVTADWVSTDGTHDWHVVIMDAELLPFVDA